MTRLRPLVARCLLALVAIPAGIATAQAPATPPASKPAARPAPSTRKVWTAAELEKLRSRPHAVTVLEGAATPQAEPVVLQATPGPQGVPARLREMVSEAQTNLDRLERERLAASNPLLRGLAAGQPIRPTAEIDKDKLKWSERLRIAETALANAEASSGTPAPN